MTNWRKYIWQIIGTLLALAAVIATYDVFFRSKPVKELQIILDSSTPLVDVKPEASQDIEIYYQGQQVQNIYLIQLSIKNTGNQPIVESDYSKNLLLMLNTEAKIVDASKVSSEPPNIEPSIVISSRNYVEFSPFLMNPGDILTVKILAIAPTNSSMDVKVDGKSIGPRSEYTFKGVKEPHSIEVVFKEGDIIPPQVLATAPENGSRNRLQKERMMVQFSEEMDEESLKQAFILTDLKGNVIPTKLMMWKTGSSVIISLQKRLERGNTYLARFTKAAKDIAGNPMAREYRWTFSTRKARKKK